MPLDGGPELSIRDLYWALRFSVSICVGLPTYQAQKLVTVTIPIFKNPHAIFFFSFKNYFFKMAVKYFT